MPNISREEAENQLRIIKKDAKEGFFYPKDWEGLIEDMKVSGHDDLAGYTQYQYETLVERLKRKG